SGKLDYVWATSWGVSTRLMGALIMAHSDDQGLVLPPKLAPIHVVIVPIYKGTDELNELRKHIEPIIEELKTAGIRVKFDTDDQRKPGWKFAEYELKGVPVRIAIGKRDLESGSVEVARRDTGEKSLVELHKVSATVQQLLDEIQENLYDRALNFRENNTTIVNSYNEFKEVLEAKGGFILAHWDGTSETEEKIKEETKATIRCIPFEESEEGKCIYTGKPSKGMVVFAKAY